LQNLKKDLSFQKQAVHQQKNSVNSRKLPRSVSKLSFDQQRNNANLGKLIKASNICFEGFIWSTKKQRQPWKTSKICIEPFIWRTKKQRQPWKVNQDFKSMFRRFHLANKETTPTLQS